MKILIVEDDRLISLMLSKMVTKMEHEVIAVFARGEKALKSIKDLKVDLILMDVMLEGDMDGIETMQKIQKKYTIPVIYITGNSDESTKQRAASTNYLDYLVKPVTYTQLSKIINSL